MGQRCCTKYSICSDKNETLEGKTSPKAATPTLLQSKERKIMLTIPMFRISETNYELESDNDPITPIKSKKLHAC